MRYRTLFLPLLLLLQSCTYAISSGVAGQADRAATFEKIQKDPAEYKGKTVILGGVIDSVRNVRTDTIIEIVQKELDYWGRPRRTDRSGGRFLALYRGLLDPLRYSPGQEITIAGQVLEMDEKGAYGSDALMMLRVREMKIWPLERSARDKPSWLDPLYDRQSAPNAPGW